MEHNIEIREMTEADIESVLEIDQLSFANPWPINIYYDELNKNSYAHYFVVTVDQKVVGFCGTWIVIDEAQITNIAIHPAYRGKRYGDGLFQHVINFAIANNVSRLSLEVRVSNIPAQQLYKKYGLVPGGIRKNYYTDNQEDALVLWVNL
ncbi:ribosomal protein S18-alanine N-acetyltransferase [Gracilibacillus marinus]|uniref:[Ribosomal protein bS18]-alanine N-acetyltransferase n=1 Tax=Gracilibacillus marinus TaxID=630535 RepID=A0ABV8W050_9BACI